MKRILAFLLTLVLIAGLVACTGQTEESDVEEVQERTFSLTTYFRTYTDAEINALLFEEILNSSPDTWDFMVLEPDKPIQDSIFMQVGGPNRDAQFF